MPRSQGDSRTFANTARTLALLGLAGTVAAAAGCYAEGGLWWSEDQHVYISRPYQPWTITLRDTRSGQDFWSVDVPVGKRLVIDFVEGEGTEDGFTPDRMDWALMDDNGEDLSTDYMGDLRNSLPVPPASARRLDPTLRAIPESAPGTATVSAPGPGEKGPAPITERPTLRRTPPSQPALRPTPEGVPEPVPAEPTPARPAEPPAPVNEPAIDLPDSR